MPAFSPVGNVQVDAIRVPEFPAAQPLVLDLGCGNGIFLSGLASLQPDWNILGVEKKDYRVRQTRRRTTALPNARVMHGEVSEALAALPEHSVSRVYLLFSDPWPKRRHAGRRLVQAEFANLVGSRLQPDGVFFFASDSSEYAEWAEDIFRSSVWKVSPWDLPVDWPATEFEQRFVLSGVQIRRFQATR